MRSLLLVGALTLLAADALAQTSKSAPPFTGGTGPGEAGLATPSGSDVSVGLASYTYTEPGDQSISIHGVKFVADFTGTLVFDEQRHWFGQGQVRTTFGNTTYDGWCSPYLITPSSASPNGYELDISRDASPCSETGDKDWYVEARLLAGKDLIGQRWGWSPYSGIGLRYLSNGTAGVPRFRTDRYLYVPLGLTARTNVASHRALSLTVEFDALVHGWQQTHDSALGGGEVPPTAAAPGFTIDSFTDVSFSQTGGWALRASAKYPLSTRMWVEPYYVRWAVNASAANQETVTFTVHNVTAREQLGFYEPFNVTNEFGVRLGFHLRR